MKCTAGVAGTDVVTAGGRKLKKRLRKVANTNKIKETL